MADPKKMSIEEILAAARASDGKSPAAPQPTPAGDAEPPAEPPAEPASKDVPASKDAPAKVDPKKMSVAEMLAAARGEKTGETAAAPTEKKAPDAPTTTPAAASKDPKQMSVADMLAAARGEKAAPAKPDAATARPAAAKPPAGTAAAKPAEKPAAPKSGPDGPKDTASILAAARKTTKPGPMSKSQAAAKGVSVPVSPAKTKLEVPPMPAKPAYAMPPAPAPSAGPDRRGFFASFGSVVLGSSLAIGFVCLAVTNLLWMLGLARFMFPNVRIEPPTRFKVGFPDNFAPGQVEDKFKAQFGVWVVRYEYEGQPQIYALSTVCTHLGCTPNWLEGEQKFKCPCHGSGFYKDGINFEGPAPRPLERYAISIADDGQLEVDKSRKFNEELGQWKDAASYVVA